MSNNSQNYNESGSVLKVEGLTLSFKSSPHVDIIKDISLHVLKGETVAIIGESGSGKSVTANTIMGLLNNSSVDIKSGEIIFHNSNLLTLSKKSLSDVYGKKVSMVFQDPLQAFNPTLSVGYQISESMIIHGVSKRTAKNRTLSLMSRVGIANSKLRYSDYPHQFSGGQRQRMLIAMAISMNPDLLIADEPTSALDSKVQNQIISLLKGIQTENNMGILFITHDIVLAKNFADRIIVMKSGRILESGFSHEIFLNPKHEYTKMLISSIPGSGMPSVDSKHKVPLLEIKGLNQSYTMKHNIFSRNKNVVNILNDISFTVYENEVLCVVGESGSGKSTLIKSLLGLQKYDSGIIKLRDRKINPKNKVDMNVFRSSVQSIFQDPSSSLDPLMNIEEIISEAWCFNSDSISSIEEKVSELLVAVGLPSDCSKRLPHEFSGGQLQRIAIARALASQPQLLIADEAVSALDVSIQYKIINLLRKLKNITGFSILFITHDLALVKDFADRVIVLSNGRVVEQGSAANIFNSPQSVVTKELLINSNLITNDLG